MYRNKHKDQAFIDKMPIENYITGNIDLKEHSTGLRTTDLHCLTLSLFYSKKYNQNFLGFV